MTARGQVAYMSNRDARDVAGWEHRRSGPDFGRMAVAEARRILEETERADVAACDHPPVRVHFAVGQRARNVRHWTPRQDVRWEAERSLAESLAAVLPVLDELEGQARQ